MKIDFRIVTIEIILNMKELKRIFSVQKHCKITTAGIRRLSGMTFILCLLVFQFMMCVAYYYHLYDEGIHIFICLSPPLIATATLYLWSQESHNNNRRQLIDKRLVVLNHAKSLRKACVGIALSENKFMPVCEVKNAWNCVDIAEFIFSEQVWTALNDARAYKLNTDANQNNQSVYESKIDKAIELMKSEMALE